MRLHKIRPSHSHSAGHLQSALGACTRGLLKVAPTARGHLPSAEGKYFELLLIQSTLSSHERSIVLAAAELRSLGLFAARQNDLGRAKDLFREASCISSEASVSFECQSLCASFQLAAEAYLDYRHKQFSAARDRLFRALVIDANLEDRGGFDLLLLHRVQLLHNLIRIYARQGRAQEALDLSFRVLDYLDGSQENLSSLVPWSPEVIKGLPQDLVSASAEQVLYEIALIVARIPEGGLRIPQSGPG